MKNTNGKFARALMSLLVLNEAYECVLVIVSKFELQLTAFHKR